MGGSSMSFTMLMVTMVVLSWRSNLMERLTILITMDMEDMNKICDKLLVLNTIKKSKSA